MSTSQSAALKLCQDKFEAWYRQQDPASPSVFAPLGDGYKYPSVQDGWELWQAAWQARAALAQREQGDTVPMPVNADAAAGMVSLGLMWLQQHAPERIKPQASAQDGKDAARYRWLRVDVAESAIPRVWSSSESAEPVRPLHGDDLDSAIDAAIAAMQPITAKEKES